MEITKSRKEPFKNRFELFHHSIPLYNLYAGTDYIIISFYVQNRFSRFTIFFKIVSVKNYHFRNNYLRYFKVLSLI